MIGIITPYAGGKTYHCKYSGYERLIEYWPNVNVYFTEDYKKLPIVWYPFRLLKLIPKRYRTFKAELRCLRENDQVFHIYGDDTFFLSGFKLFRKNKKVVVTFHQPDKIFKGIMPFYWKFLLKDVDIIVVSPSQERFFLKHFPRDKVHLIPHGVDIHYFKPGKVKKKKQIVSVGNHLRDYETLLKAMEIVNKKIKDLKLLAIGREPKKKYNANYEFTRKISDSALLKSYQESLFQVIPLKEVTANNALLEGCACGLPLISIDSENIKFYFKEVIVYKDYKDLALKIINTYENLDKDKVDVTHLCWENIVKKLRLLFPKEKDF